MGAEALVELADDAGEIAGDEFERGDEEVRGAGAEGAMEIDVVIEAGLETHAPKDGPGDGGVLGLAEEEDAGLLVADILDDRGREMGVQTEAGLGIGELKNLEVKVLAERG